MDGRLAALRPNLDLHAAIADGVSLVERDDLVEILTSRAGRPNLDTQDHSALVTRIVCKRRNKLCIHSIMTDLSKQNSQIIGTVTPQEWERVLRGRK